MPISPQTLESFFNTPLLMSLQAAEFLKFAPAARIDRRPDPFLASLLPALAQESGLPQADLHQDITQVSSLSGLLWQSDQPRRQPYQVMDGGIAVIPVRGTLESAPGLWGNYFTGYDSIEMRALAAQADPEVRGIALTIASHGGDFAGCFECAAVLRQVSAEKPVWALVKHAALSAGYAIAAAAQKVVGTPSAEVGSVGVILAHIDESALLEQIGIAVTLVYQGQQKADGNPFEALPDPVRHRLEAKIQTCYDRFVTAVAGYRNINESAVRATESGIFMMADAIGLGLADQIMPAADFFHDFRTFLDQRSTGGLSMPEKTADAGGAPVNGDSAEPQLPGTVGQSLPQPPADIAATAERQRIDAILSCNAATGRATLARHLALKTDMPAPAAQSILAVAPIAEPASGAGQEFFTAMSGDDHPNIKSDGDGDSDQKPSGAAKMFALFDKANPARAPHR